jgi:hypothetical protein
MGQLNNYQLLRLLKNAVSLSPTLHSVQLTDNYDQQRGKFPLEYVQYKELLYTAADNLDSLKPSSRGTSRKAHKAELNIAVDHLSLRMKTPQERPIKILLILLWQTLQNKDHSAQV